MMTKLISVFTIMASLTMATVTQAMVCQNATGSISISEDFDSSTYYHYHLVITKNRQVFGEVETDYLFPPHSDTYYSKMDLELIPITKEITLKHQVDSISDLLTFAVEIKVTHLITGEILQDWFICESPKYIMSIPSGILITP